MDFLEIIIEHFVNFDTELILADEWVHKPFPEVINPSYRTKKSSPFVIHSTKTKYLSSSISSCSNFSHIWTLFKKMRRLWGRCFWSSKIKFCPLRLLNSFNASSSTWQKVIRQGQMHSSAFYLPISLITLTNRTSIVFLLKAIFTYFLIFCARKGFPRVRLLRLWGWWSEDSWVIFNKYSHYRSTKRLTSNSFTFRTKCIFLHSKPFSSSELTTFKLKTSI